MTERPDTPKRDAILAAEYALSLLGGAERQEAERRMLTDPAFRAEVEAWQDGLAETYAGEIADQAPRARVKRRLMARLFETPGQRARPWRLFGLASFAASLVLSAILVLPVLAPPVAPEQDLAVFDVAAADGSLVVLATLDHATRTLYFTRSAGEAAQGRALELWAIQGGNPPVSLGVLPEAPGGILQIPQGIGAAGLVLAISDEPEGGSPTGAPTGTILATGEVVEL